MENFFQSSFVCIKNASISKHFFTHDKSILDLIHEQKKHTESILKNINDHITFNNKSIKIERYDILEKLRENSSKFLTLSGVAGVGKTAVIKNLYEQAKNIPFYIFNAAEFELRNISYFFKLFDFQEFISFHREEHQKHKIIVIDSAEKLFDLKNPEPFKEFLSTLTNDNWKIIFTVRDNYLKKLNDDFFRSHTTSFRNIELKTINQHELHSTAKKYSFVLPSDGKILDLIKIPFYLNEYLKHYESDLELNYIKFKESIWNKTIEKDKPSRTECFLNLAYRKAEQGTFFISPNNELSILDEFIKDRILGHEANKGYFITHDIYEEWALENKINREYLKASDHKSFFKNLTSSPSICKSFRNWLSEKILLKENIKNFIEYIVRNNDIEECWKDEMLVSILLSDYSDTFFIELKATFLQNKCSLLKKISYLLKSSCKEINKDFYKQSNVQEKDIDLLKLKYILMQPKGKGWEVIIKFFYENIESINKSTDKSINFILPIIHDWNGAFKSGNTTRYSSLIALQYYKEITFNNSTYLRNQEEKDKLLETILHGLTEIKEELKFILKEVLKNKWKNHNEPYSELSEAILRKTLGFQVSKLLPEMVIKLADLFWSYTYKENGSSQRYFDSQYFPPSLYKTPIYFLLKADKDKTINFILELTNKSIELFVKSDPRREYSIEEVKIYINKNKIIKQYVSNELWCMYRGTQPDSPYLLQSIHMALEKFLLEEGEDLESQALEELLFSILERARSASISAIIASVVLKYYEKTFNVAKVLFKTKEFFLYDNNRFTLDEIKIEDKLFEKERIESSKEKHRKNNLEGLFLCYQVLANEKESKKSIEDRQKALWEILDNYYKKIPPEEEQTEEDKIWRFCLTRMDSRKMKPEIEGDKIYFKPEVDPKLKQESESTQAKIHENIKYISLNNWSSSRLENNAQYKNYKQYENNPKLALSEAKEIIRKLDLVKNKKSSHPQAEYNKNKYLDSEYIDSNDNDFCILNEMIPEQVLSVLIRDFFGKFPREDKLFCKNIILEIAHLTCVSGPYQCINRTRPAISALPILMRNFPDEKERIKEILLFKLLNNTFDDYIVRAMSYLWEHNFQDAQSILFGYLYLNPKFFVLKKEMEKENYDNYKYYLQKYHRDYLQKIINNEISISDISEFSMIDLNTLFNTLKLIPLKIENNEHKEIVKRVIPIFIDSCINKNNAMLDLTGYFLIKICDFILNSPKIEIKSYIDPFLKNFDKIIELTPDLFNNFIMSANALNSYENFWEVWELFKDTVVEKCNRKNNGFAMFLIISYLFAKSTFGKPVTYQRRLIEDKGSFFKEISENIGHHSSTLYAISKMLNDNDGLYLEDGIIWISSIINKNKTLFSDENKNYNSESYLTIKKNTICYIENIVREYIHVKNINQIKKHTLLKNNITTILDFLAKNGSSIGHQLRDNIR